MPVQASRLAYNTLSWTSEVDLARVFATISAAGWAGVELLNVDPGWSGPPSRVRRLLEDTGLAAVAVLGTVQIDERAPAWTERQKRAIEFGAEIGVGTYVFVGADRVPMRLPTEDEVRRLADVAHALIEHAEPFGITVNHHSHPRATIERADEQDRLLALADPRLRVCFDAGIALWMDEDPIEQIRHLGPRIGYVHLKDHARGTYCVLGQGTHGVDWAALLRTLDEVGYGGWVTTELSPYADTGADESCVANRDYLGSIGV